MGRRPQSPRKSTLEKGRRRVPRSAKHPSRTDRSIQPAANLDVFLNVPYDDQFSSLFVAYVIGLVALGLAPRASLEIPGGAARLDKITDLIGHCSQSVHDLSRVE